jgi:hypothetical protein
MEDTNEAVHIYLKQQKDIKSIENISSHERYIILMNETLQSDNRELRSTIKDLEVKTDELENETDRNEVSTRYMKGMLKNFVELSKLQQKYRTVTDTILTDNKNYLKRFKSETKKQLRVFELISLPAVFLIWQFMFTLSIIGFITIIEYTLLNLHYPSNDKNAAILKELTREIKTIQDAQDFIGDHIDNI